MMCIKYIIGWSTKADNHSLNPDNLLHLFMLWQSALTDQQQ